MAIRPQGGKVFIQALLLFYSLNRGTAQGLLAHKDTSQKAVALQAVAMIAASLKAACASPTATAMS